VRWTAVDGGDGPSLNPAAPVVGPVNGRPSAPDGLLTTDEVMARYRLHDRRAARRIMDEVGSFAIAGKLFVLEADLLAHEKRLMARRPSGSPSPAGRSRARTSPQKRSTGPLAPLPSDWHRRPLARP
jgi:hypothetical protein